MSLKTWLLGLTVATVGQQAVSAQNTKDSDPVKPTIENTTDDDILKINDKDYVMPGIEETKKFTDHEFVYKNLTKKTFRSTAGNVTFGFADVTHNIDHVVSGNSTSEIAFVKFRDGDKDVIIAGKDIAENSKVKTGLQLALEYLKKEENKAKKGYEPGSEGHMASHHLKATAKDLKSSGSARRHVLELSNGDKIPLTSENVANLTVNKGATKTQGNPGMGER